MLRRFRLSPAMVVAWVALMVALGGSAYAMSSLRAGSVGSKQLKKNAVTTAKIKNHAVTGSKLNLKGVTVPNAQNATNATNASNLTGAGWGVEEGGILEDGHNATVTNTSTGKWCISVTGASPATAPMTVSNDYTYDVTEISPSVGSASGVEWDDRDEAGEGCASNQYAVITYGIKGGTSSGLDTYYVSDSFTFFVP